MLFEIISRDVLLSGDRISEFTAGRFGGSLFMIIVTSVSLIVFSGYYLFFMNIITNKTKIKFNQVLNLVIYSSIIAWLNSFLSIVYIFTKDLSQFSSLSDFNSMKSSLLSLSAIFGSFNVHWINVFLNTFSILLIWQSIIIIIGLSKIYKSKIKISIIPELVLMVILYVINLI